MLRPRLSSVVLALALIAALAIASPGFGLSKSIRNAIKKEVAKQVAKATGPPGPAGANGANGAAGAPGTSVFASTIPSGTTIRGAFVANDVANDTDGSAIALASISFPVPAPADLADDQVNFAPNANASDDDPACTGNVADPIAPPGKVCLYMDGYVGGASAASGENISDVAGANRFGFQVLVAPGTTVNPSRAAVDGNWAYTAP